jgi:serine protease
MAHNFMRRSSIFVAFSAVGLYLLTACTAPLGTLEGQVFSPITPVALPSQARFVTGQAIVKWKAGANSSSLGVQNLKAQSLGQMELLSLPNATLGVSATAASGQTLEWIAELRRDPNIEFAEPNFYRYTQQTASGTTATPNDTLYNQANLPRFSQIGLEGAWRQTVGSSSVTVAVLDDGILWKQDDPSASHPDLTCGRILPGYDFVSNSQNGDGDGRDSDPYASSGEGHGSHVAGIIGACTNNRLGIAGVDWNARILPVRVLGKEGGTDADIVDGLRWAVGLSVNGVVVNPNPAKVINMSLGGFGISRVFDEAINEATTKGAIVVVAAGNDQADAILYSPAGNERVITVGATDNTGQKASFSNFGAALEVMAPGTSILSTARGTGGHLDVRTAR